MAEVVPLKTIGIVGGNVNENRKVSNPPTATTDQRDQKDLDDKRRGDHRIGCTDRFENADLGYFLQNLDLEESTNDQQTDEERESALGIECALLRRVTRQGLNWSSLTVATSTLLTCERMRVTDRISR